MRLTLNAGDDQFRELEYGYNGIVWVIAWDANNVVDITKWSNCEGGQLQRFYCVYSYIYSRSH